MIPDEASVPASNSNEVVRGICGEMDGNGDGNGETIGVGLADADGKGVAEATGEGAGITEGSGVGEIDGHGEGNGSPTCNVSGAIGLRGERNVDGTAGGAIGVAGDADLMASRFGNTPSGAPGVATLVSCTLADLRKALFALVRPAEVRTDNTIANEVKRHRYFLIFLE
jgi:hypothetical protein